jgi:hypothetical protein
MSIVLLTLLYVFVITFAELVTAPVEEDYADGYEEAEQDYFFDYIAYE